MFGNVHIIDQIQLRDQVFKPMSVFYSPILCFVYNLIVSMNMKGLVTWTSCILTDGFSNVERYGSDHYWNDT